MHLGHGKPSLRENERLLNKQREESICKLLLELHQALLACNLQIAMDKLKSAAHTASEISYVDDLQEANRIFIHQEIFSDSIKTLSTALDDFNNASSANGHAHYLTTALIDDVLRQSKLNVYNTLLPRHYDYLINAIKNQLIVDWIKFHERDEAEYAALFDKIKDIIATDLTTTAWWQRWAPNNWTNAGLCLHQGTKEKIARQICELIHQYQPSSPPAYVQLKILPLHNPNDVPVVRVARLFAAAYE